MLLYILARSPFAYPLRLQDAFHFAGTVCLSLLASSLRLQDAFRFKSTVCLSPLASKMLLTSKVLSVCLLSPPHCASKLLLTSRVLYISSQVINLNFYSFQYYVPSLTRCCLYVSSAMSHHSLATTTIILNTKRFTPQSLMLTLHSLLLSPVNVKSASSYPT